MRYLDRITNPDDTPVRWLTKHLTDASHFYAHVGYLDRPGIRLIETPLRDMLERGGQVHIVVDYRDNNPQHRDIAWLVDMFAPYRERATLRLVSDQDRLHAKVFALHLGDASRTALVGSANLTAAGLSRNWEACIAVESGDTTTLDSVFAAVNAWQNSPTAIAVDLGKISALAKLNAATGSTKMLCELFTPALDEIEAAGTNGPAPIGISTGFAELDQLLTGLRAGQLVLVAGRTTMGKTTLAMDFLRSAAIRHDIPSLMLSFEMTNQEITQRVLAAEARIPLHAIRSGNLSDDEWTKLAHRMAEIAEAPLHVNDSCPASIRSISEEIRRSVAEDGIRLVVVDYIQQLTADRRVENRQQEITEIARALKRLGLELGITIIVVSQLNRGPEMRVDKRPQLSDLRDSGTLEEAADVVILLHREDYYDKETPRAGEADFIVAKHRNGPTYTVTVAAQLHLSRFVDMAAYKQPVQRMATS